MDLLETKNLVKHFPIRGDNGKHRVLKAVDGVDLTIAPGETLGLVGESGCGKSTVGRVILRLIEPTSGTVTFDGHDVISLDPDSLRKLRRDMQLIFQDPFASLDPRMTAGSIVAEPLLVQKVISQKQVRDAAVELLRTVGLDAEYIDRYPHEFSGGQRQRLAIARAVALKPKFVVADEPVSALDLSVRAQIVNLLSDLQEQFGLAYLFIAHDLELVRRVSDRIAVMYLGKIVEISSAEEFHRDPRHPYTKALLAASLKAEPGAPLTPLEGEPPSPVDIPSGCRFRARCPIAGDVCAEKEPELMGANNHLAGCHYAW